MQWAAEVAENALVLVKRIVRRQQRRLSVQAARLS
jgi:hypothetical protein